MRVVARLGDAAVAVVAGTGRDAAAERGDQRAGWCRSRTRAVQARALARSGSCRAGAGSACDRLGRRAVLGRAACRVALYDEELGVARRRAPSSRPACPAARRRLEHGSCGASPRAPCGRRSRALQRLVAFVDDLASRAWVLLEVLGQALGHGRSAPARRISELPSFALVWPSNCGSGSFTEMTADRPSRASSPDRLASFSLSRPCRASVLVDRAR